MCITCIVFVFAIVMSTQIIKVYQKDQEYIAKYFLQNTHIDLYNKSAEEEKIQYHAKNNTTNGKSPDRFPDLFRAEKCCKTDGISSWKAF